MNPRIRVREGEVASSSPVSPHCLAPRAYGAFRVSRVGRGSNEVAISGQSIRPESYRGTMNASTRRRIERRRDDRAELAAAAWRLADEGRGWSDVRSLERSAMSAELDVLKLNAILTANARRIFVAHGGAVAGA